MATRCLVVGDGVLSLLLVQWVEDHHESVAFEPGLTLDLRDVRQLVLDLVHHCQAAIAEAVLPAAKEHVHLELVTVLQELTRFPHLGLEIVGIDLRPDTNFFDDDLVLLLPCVVFFLLCEVLLLSEVLNLAHRRTTFGRNLNEVEPLLPRHVHGGLDVDDAMLLTLVIDEAYLPHANLFVEPDLDLCRGYVLLRCDSGAASGLLRFDRLDTERGWRRVPDRASAHRPDDSSSGSDLLHQPIDKAVDRHRAEITLLA